ncbi:MAG: BatD family protein [Candidatus Zixiibacteriota bacterium]
MKTTKLAVILSVVFWNGLAFSNEISVTQSLDKSEVAYDGTAQLQVTLTWKGSQFAYLFDKPLSPVTDRLKIREFSTSLSTTGTGADEVTTKIFRFTLVPTSSGIGKIQPITVSYLKWPDSIPGVLTTEELSLGIGERKSVEKSGSIPTTAIVFSVLGFMAMLAGVFLVMRHRSRQNAIPQISPKEIFLERLSRLKADSGGDFGKFQSGLYHLLGEFVAVRYTVRPEGMSEEDLAGGLNSAGMTYSTAQKIAKWYVAAREDRFRPLQPEPGALVRLETDIRVTMEKM